MEDMENKECGMALILEPAYTLEDLREYVMASCLQTKFGDNSFSSVTTICDEFLTLLQSNQKLNLDEITSMFVAVSITYFVNETAGNQEHRLCVLEKTFRYADSLNPIHIHFACKRMFSNLKKKDYNSIFNILRICDQIATASEMGRAIAISLMWTILLDVGGNDNDIYCFRKFPELRQLLQPILENKPSLQVQYVLITVTAFLLNAVVFGDNTDLKKAGYSQYFNYSRRELDKLREVAEGWSSSLNLPTTKTTHFWDLRMIISEYISTNILGILHDKIADMEK